MSARRYLCGQDSQSGQASQPARGAVREVRAGDQPQDRQGAWADDPAVTPPAGGPGDRVSRPQNLMPPSRRSESMRQRPFTSVLSMLLVVALITGCTGPSVDQSMS